MKKNKIQKTNAMRQLETGKINYEVHEYAWSDDQSDVEFEVPFEKLYKTLVAVGNKTGEIVTCIQAPEELDLKKLAKKSGNKKVDMLNMEDLEKVTGYIRGGCSPVGMKRQFPTFIADEAETMNTIVVSSGRRGMQMELKPDELIKMTRGQYGDITDK